MSRLHVVYKIDALNKFAKFTGPQLQRSLIFVSLQVVGQNSYQKRTPLQVFFCQFCDFIQTIFFIEHLWATAFALTRW